MPTQGRRSKGLPCPDSPPPRSSSRAVPGKVHPATRGDALHGRRRLVRTGGPLSPLRQGSLGKARPSLRSPLALHGLRRRPTDARRAAIALLLAFDRFEGVPFVAAVADLALVALIWLPQRSYRRYGALRLRRGDHKQPSPL